MIGYEIYEIIEKHFDSLLQRYQKDLEGSMKPNGFIFDIVDWLYYKLHKIGSNQGELYIDFQTWLKNKNVTKNPKNNHGKYF